MFIVMSRRKLVRRLTFLLTLLLLTLITSAVGRGVLFRPASANTDQPLTRASSRENLIALTFDVTWGQDELTRILTVLDGAGVKATFFVGGTFLTLHGESVRQIAAKGHEIGTLGVRITDLTKLTEQDVTSGLRDSQSALTRIIGGPVRYFRPPQGVATPSVVRGARAASLTTITFSIDSGDHLGIKAAQIAQRVTKQASKGDIVLLSASDYSKETSKALPDLIKGLKERGLKPVRLSELMPPEPQP